MSAHEHRVYLLRHGQTEWSSSGKHTGVTDVPLTEAAERAAPRTGRTLTALGAEPATVLSSPRSRARRTAELAGLTGITVEPLLAEWDYGAYEGLTTAQIREFVPEWTIWTHSCADGESFEDITRRADEVVRLMTTHLPYGDVVLVGHGHFSRSLIARWMDMPVSAGVRFALAPAGITVLGHERGVRQITRSNVPTPACQ